MFCIKIIEMFLTICVLIGHLQTHEFKHLFDLLEKEKLSYMFSYSLNKFLESGLKFLRFENRFSQIRNMLRSQADCCFPFVVKLTIT